MAVAPQWATAFAKVVVTNVTDVNQLITAIRTLLTVTLPVGSQWTESPSQTWTSPADPVSGYTMQVVVSRNAALQLICQCFNQSGTLVCNAGVDPTSGSAVNIYAGPTHFYIHVPSSTISGANGSCFACAIADPSPEAKNASTNVVFCKAALTNGFVTTNNFAADGWFCFDAGHSSPTVGGTGGIITGALATGGINLVLKTSGGSELALPACGSIQILANFSHMRHSGLIPQFAWVDKGHTVGSSIVVPIDIGVTATFDVIGAPGQFSENNQGPAILAVRSA